MAAYHCTFKFEHPSLRGGNEMVTVVGSALRDFSDGFWITKDLEFTKVSDNVFWIPPSAIKYIEKVQS
jgi:hypothetical protein